MKVRAYCLLLGLFCLFTACSNEAREAVSRGIAYVEEELIDPLGLVESYPYRAEEVPYQPDYKREALSETAGLWMQVLVRAGRKERFERQVRVLKEHFLLPSGTLSWRVLITPGGSTPDPDNATIDDLRIIGALLDAARKWKEPRYRLFALQLAGALKKSAVYDSLLLHASKSPDDTEGPFVADLSYLDLAVMDRLASSDPFWQAVYEKSLGVLLKGMRANGFFYDKYDAGKGRYFNDEKNLINQVIAAVHLAERGFPGGRMMSFFKTEWERDKKIAGSYDLDGRRLAGDFENGAVYGLLMQFARLERDLVFYEQLKKRVLLLAARENRPRWEGALCPDACHAFDHFQILLALGEEGG